LDSLLFDDIALLDDFGFFDIGNETAIDLQPTFDEGIVSEDDVAEWSGPVDAERRKTATRERRVVSPVMTALTKWVVPIVMLAMDEGSTDADLTEVWETGQPMLS
jgi:hypothetical protein